MLFIASYLILAVIPGWLLAIAAGFHQSLLLLSIALSLAISVANTVIVKLLDVSLEAVILITLTEVLILTGFLCWKMPGRLKQALPVFDSATSPSFIGIMTAVGVYAWLTGPYLEVPADTWWHLAKINDALQSFSQAGSGSGDWIRLIMSAPSYGYVPPAMAAALTGNTTWDVADELNFANTLLFCGGIYSFAVYIFERSGLSGWQKQASAALTVVFFILQFGVNVFSYVRYYTFAPAYLDYLVYLSSVVLILESVRRGIRLQDLVVFLVLLVTAFLVHAQEFLFIVLMVSFIFALEYRNSRSGINGLPHRLHGLILGVIAVVWLSLWLYSYLNLNRADALAYGTIIPLQNILPFLKNLYIADPSYQFYQVVGVWGLLVYTVFFVMLFKGERFSSFLVAGMLMPAVTLFNPFFVDLFLRHNYPDVIWRISYVIPLPFLGAYIFVKAISSTGGTMVQTRLQRATGAVVALLLIVLLFPISTTYFESKFSRMHTIGPVDQEVGYHQWQDVLSFLNNIDAGTVITDQVTGYLINAFTPHYYRGHKFYGFGAPNIRKSAYSEQAFADYAGSLIIVNRRDGGLSETGRISGHWPEHILKVSQFYSPEFLSHLRLNPEKYRKIWDNENIQVYEIQS